VRIVREPERFRLVEEPPAKDAILAQVLTTPFAAAAYAAAPDGDFTVDAGPLLDAGLKGLGVRGGSMDVSGGIAGGASSFELSGAVRVASLGALRTLVLDVHAASAERVAHMKTAQTFVRDTDGRLASATLHAGTLLPPPCREVVATGRLDDPPAKLTLEFKPGACGAHDAFSASGSMEVTADTKPSF
jgi:hypothetical protein